MRSWTRQRWRLSPSIGSKRTSRGMRSSSSARAITLPASIRAIVRPMLWRNRATPRSSSRGIISGRRISSPLYSVQPRTLEHIRGPEAPGIGVIVLAGIAWRDFPVVADALVLPKAKLHLSHCDLAAELAIDPGTAWNLHLIAAANAANRCDDLLIAVPSLGVNVAVDLAAAMPVGRNFARSALFRLKRRVGCIRSRGH